MRSSVYSKSMAGELTEKPQRNQSKNKTTPSSAPSSMLSAARKKEKRKFVGRYRSKSSAWSKVTGQFSVTGGLRAISKEKKRVVAVAQSPIYAKYLPSSTWREARFIFCIFRIVYQKIYCRTFIYVIMKLKRTVSSNHYYLLVIVSKYWFLVAAIISTLSTL